MSKARTLLRLLAHRDWTGIRRRWLIHTGAARVARHGGRAFVHRDFGFRSVCHPDWPDSLEAFLTQAQDERELALLRQWVRAGDTVFDIGVNIGQYTCAAAAAMHADGRIVAVDADEFAVLKLQQTAKLLRTGNIVPVHAAVTDHTGSVDFFVHTDRSETGIQSLRPAAHQVARTTRVSVSAHTLASLAQAHAGDAGPSLVKIDIEGAEAQAMAQTPAQWLGADGPLWIVEINPSALAQFGCGPAQLAARFDPRAFELSLLPKHPLHAGGSVERRALTPDEAFVDSMYYNLLAIPRGERWRDRRAQVDRWMERA